MTARSSQRVNPVKRPDEIEALRVAAEVVSGVHKMLRERIVPGVVTSELDNWAEEYIRDQGATSAFKGYVMGDDEDNPYPATLCISINDIVVHGIPGDTLLKEGDIVAVDVGVVKDGYHGDCAFTYGVGEIDESKQRLLETTVEALYLGIEQAVAGNWVYDIAGAIQKEVERKGYGVVRELVGHGIGRSLHEDPAVPNFVPHPFVRHRFQNQKLVGAMVICIEPMVNAGTYKVDTEDDGWTVRTHDGLPSAHFEHMVVVREGEAEILTNHIPEPVTELVT